MPRGPACCRYRHSPRRAAQGVDFRAGLALQPAPRRERRNVSRLVAAAALNPPPSCGSLRKFCTIARAAGAHVVDRCCPFGSACSLRLLLDWHHRRGSAESLQPAVLDVLQGERWLVTAVHRRVQAGRNSGIVVRSEVSCECGGAHCAGGNWPGAVQKTLQKRSNSCEACRSSTANGCNVLVRTERCAEDEEALAIAGENPVSGPDELLALLHFAAFQMQALPQLSSMRACSRSARWHASSSSRIL